MSQKDTASYHTGGGGVRRTRTSIPSSPVMTIVMSSMRAKIKEAPVAVRILGIHPCVRMNRLGVQNYFRHPTWTNLKLSYTYPLDTIRAAALNCLARMSSYYGSRSSSSSSSPDNYTCVGGTILLLARIVGLVVVFLVKDHTNFFTAPMETRERGESCATCAARAAEEELLFCVSPAAVGNPASFQSVLVPNLRNPPTYNAVFIACNRYVVAGLAEYTPEIFKQRVARAWRDRMAPCYLECTDCAIVPVQQLLLVGNSRRFVYDLNGERRDLRHGFTHVLMDKSVRDVLLSRLQLPNHGSSSAS